MVKLAMVGCGKWGQNIYKTAISLGYVVDIFDRNSLHLLASPDRCEEYEGCILATPPVDRIPLLRFLWPIKKLFVEKPVVLGLEELRLLEELVTSSQKFYFVNYIHLFNSAYQEFKHQFEENLRNNHKLLALSSVGGNKGPFRETYSGDWDYGPHDLSLLYDLMGADLRVEGKRTFPTPGTLIDFASPQEKYKDTKIQAQFGNSLEVKTRLLRAEFAHEILEWDDIKMNRSHHTTYTTPLENSLRAFVGMDVTKNDTFHKMTQFITKVLSLPNLLILLCLFTSCSKEEVFLEEDAWTFSPLGFTALEKYEKKGNDFYADRLGLKAQLVLPILHASLLKKIKELGPKGFLVRVKQNNSLLGSIFIPFNQSSSALFQNSSSDQINYTFYILVSPQTQVGNLKEITCDITSSKEVIFPAKAKMESIKTKFYPRNLQSFTMEFVKLYVKDSILGTYNIEWGLFDPQGSFLYGNLISDSGQFLVVP